MSMRSRGGVDGADSQELLFELKSAPRLTSPVTSVWWSSVVPSQARWFHLVPLLLLLIVGATVPGFLTTFVLLVCSIALALGVFLLSVQLPVGYLLRYWRDLRVGRSARRPTRRRTPSSGN
jgi:hypothetical protein